MAACKICGKSAGWFRDVHEACVRADEQRRAAATAASAAEAAAAKELARREKAVLRDIANAAKEAARGMVPISSVAKELEIAKSQLSLSLTRRRELATDAWVLAVDEVMEDGLLTAEEESRAIELAESIGLARADIDQSDAYWHLVKGAVLRDVLDGRWPERVQIDAASLPFNLQKGERIAWIFKDAEYLKLKTRHLALARAEEISVPTGEGGFTSISAFIGHTISQPEQLSHGSGVLGVSQKNLYFAGSQKSVRVPFAKIISFNRFEDGLGFHRDGANALPEYFRTGDGWFVYNLAINIQNLAVIPAERPRFLKKR